MKTKTFRALLIALISATQIFITNNSILFMLWIMVTILWVGIVFHELEENK